MKKHFHKPRDKTIVAVMIFSIVSIFGITVGYSALNTELLISGDAYVRVNDDIRITDIKMMEATNGAYEIYNSKYSKDTTSMFVSLPNTNSTITYEVTVANNSSIRYQLKNVLENSYTNKNISYEIIGLKINEIIPKNSTVKFKIKFTTNTTNQETNVLLNYVFQKFTSIAIVEPNANVTGNFHTVSDSTDATGFNYGWANYLGIDLSALHVSYRNNKGSVFSNEPIDVTNLETINFDIRMVANHADLTFITYIGIIDPLTVQDTDYTKFTRVQSLSKKGTVISDHMVTIDVSDLTGNYFLKMTSIHGGEVEAFTGFTAIKSIYLK